MCAVEDANLSFSVGTLIVCEDNGKSCRVKGKGASRSFSILCLNYPKAESLAYVQQRVGIAVFLLQQRVGIAVFLLQQRRLPGIPDPAGNDPVHQAAAEGAFFVDVFPEVLFQTPPVNILIDALFSK